MFTVKKKIDTAIKFIKNSFIILAHFITKIIIFVAKIFFK